MKKISFLLLAIILTACTPQPTQNGSASSSASSTPISSSEEHWQSYYSSTYHYEIQYPLHFIAKQNDTVITNDFTATGTSFVFPESYRTGNTLDEAKVTVSVQSSCPASQMTASTTETFNEITYQKKDWDGAGAGNLYQGTTYSAMHHSSCYIITLYMHSCNLGPDCSPGHTTPFDKQKLQDVLKDMMNSLVLDRPAYPTTF